MLNEVLDETLVAPQVEASAKEEIIDLLLDRVCATGKVHDRDLARADIIANEARMSTGMQHGIAVPHAKSDAVDELVAAVGVTRRPLRLAGLDGEEAQIFILTLSPRSFTGPHIRFLAEISRLLRHRHLRDALIAAATPAAMLEVLRG